MKPSKAYGSQTSSVRPGVGTILFCDFLWAYIFSEALSLKFVSVSTRSIHLYHFASALQSSSEPSLNRGVTAKWI